MECYVFLALKMPQNRVQSTYEWQEKADGQGAAVSHGRYT